MGVPTQEGCCRETVCWLYKPHPKKRRENETNNPREMQLFLISFIVVEICEIFTVGGFPLDDAVRKVSRIDFATIPTV